MTVPSGSSAIDITDVRKSFGENVVLDSITAHVAPGTVYALLGPNGAGKTTLVNILTTLIPADSGTARVAGFDVSHDGNAVRAAIGVTGQFAAIDGIMNGEENLRLMADLQHLPRAQARVRIAELLERFDLTDAAKRPAATYSGGMRRRLDLAMSLIRSPQIVFLDEPTTGLDPRGRAIVWDIVRELVAEGVTIFLTTQYLEEADQLADRIAVLNDGRIVAEGTAAELKHLVPGGHIFLHFVDPASFATSSRLFPESVPNDTDLSLRVPGGADIAAVRHVLDTLDRADVSAETLHIVSPDLDDVFFALTGSGITNDKDAA